MLGQRVSSEIKARMEKLLKNIIVLHALMLLLAPAAHMYSAVEHAAVEQTSSYLVDIIVVAFSVVYIGCLYLIYRLKPLGRKLYFPLLCFSIGLIFVLPIDFFAHKSHLTVFIYDIINITAGIILALIHFTDVKSQFSN